MAKRNPAVTEVDAFTAGYMVLADKLIRHIKPQLDRGVPVRTAVNSAFRELRVRSTVRDLVTEFLIVAFVKGGIDTVSNVRGLKRWFLDKHWDGDKLTLSDRINKLQFKAIIIDDIKTNMRAGASWLELANSMTAKKLQTGDIAKHITDLVHSARSATDLPSVKAYRTALLKSEKAIASLAQGGAPTRRLKAAYEDVVRATKVGASKGLDKAINRAVLEKARYNAQRIARTEIARAYGEGYKRDLYEDKDATGTRWSLSSRHNVYDICDINAKVDMYGMGRGVYPKGKLPRYPAHPHCLCLLSKVYTEPKRRFKPDGGVDYIERQSVARQKELLGVANQAKFEKNPTRWRELVPMYEMGTDKPSVPKKFLKK